MFSGKRFALIAALVLSLVIPMQSPANADLTDDNNAVKNSLQPEQEMFWLTEPIKNSEFAPVIGFTSEKPWSYSFTGSFGNLDVPISNVSYSDGGLVPFKTCEGWSDPKCRKSGNHFRAQLFLPPCVEDATSSCIESLFIAANGNSGLGKLLRTTDVSNGCKYGLEYCSKASQTTSFPAIPRENIPAGSAPSLWSVDGVSSAAGTNTFMASAKFTINGKWDKNLNLSDIEFEDFEASVIPFLEVTGTFSPGFHFKEGGGTWGGNDLINSFKPNETDNSGCAWKEDGKCGIAAAFAPNTRVELGLRVPKELDGWLQGRISDANVELLPFNKKLNRLTISGTAIEIPVSGTYFHPSDVGFIYKNSELLNSYLLHWGPNWGSYPNRTTNRHGVNVNYLSVFEKYLGDEAIGRVSLWSVNLLKEEFSCENKKTPRLEGLLTTNAMVYNGGLPTYKKGALSYQVGGLHYNHDGTVFKGSYDFIMRSDTARCIYGFTKAPVQVAVTITDVNGLQSASTSSVSESGGWLRIRARDFTFSTPTITAKITQRLTASVKNDKISQKSLAKIAKVSIGKKDKVTMSVSGSNKKFAKVTSGVVNFKKNGTYQVKIKVKHYKGTTETATISVKVK